MKVSDSDQSIRSEGTKYVGGAELRRASSVDRSKLQNPTQSEITDLYASYSEPLSIAIRNMFGDGPPDPEDVAQQAFQKLIERGNLETISNLKGFLWQTARNVVLGAKRSAAVRTRYDFEVEQIYFALNVNESSPENIILVKEQLDIIRKALLKMPQKRRRAILMHRVEGLTMTEIGHRLGITRQSVAQHITKGVAELDVIFMFDGERSPL